MWKKKEENGNNSRDANQKSYTKSKGLNVFAEERKIPLEREK